MSKSHCFFQIALISQTLFESSCFNSANVSISRMKSADFKSLSSSGFLVIGHVLYLEIHSSMYSFSNMCLSAVMTGFLMGSKVIGHTSSWLSFPFDYSISINQQCFDWFLEIHLELRDWCFRQGLPLWLLPLASFFPQRPSCPLSLLRRALLTLTSPSLLPSSFFLSVHTLFAIPQSVFALLEFLHNSAPDHLPNWEPGAQY